MHPMPFWDGRWVSMASGVTPTRPNTKLSQCQCLHTVIWLMPKIPFPGSREWRLGQMLNRDQRPAWPWPKRDWFCHCSMRHVKSQNRDCVNTDVRRFCSYKTNKPAHELLDICVVFFSLLHKARKTMPVSIQVQEFYNLRKSNWCHVHQLFFSGHLWTLVSHW